MDRRCITGRHLKDDTVPRKEVGNGNSSQRICVLYLHNCTIGDSEQRGSSLTLKVNGVQVSTEKVSQVSSFGLSTEKGTTLEWKADSKRMFIRWLRMRAPFLYITINLYICNVFIILKINITQVTKGSGRTLNNKGKTGACRAVVVGCGARFEYLSRLASYRGIVDGNIRHFGVYGEALQKVTDESCGSRATSGMS